MTHRRKELYQKIKRIIDYNTLNTVQGPTIRYGSLRNIIGDDYDTQEVEKALVMLKKNGEIFEINREKKEFSLRTDDHLLAIIEKEADLPSPDKELIGHINQMRQKT